jgi:hypothetical protein
MKALITLSAFLLSITLNAQTYKLYQTENIHNQLKLNTKTGEIYQIQNDGQKFLVNIDLTFENETPGRYALYKTENMWTYILLDTFDGKLWQCQYSVDGPEYRFCLEINPYRLAYTEKSVFTIQPMTSMYQFYLINDDTGDMWKFQWSTEGDDYRWIEKY